MMKLGVVDTIGGLAMIKNIVINAMPDDDMQLKEYLISCLVNAEAYMLNTGKQEFEKMVGDIDE